MPTDKFGQPRWYPPKPGKLVYEQSPNPEDDRLFFTDGNVTMNSDGSWKVTSGMDNFRPKVLSVTNFNQIGCSMDQSEAKRKGYGWKEATDFGNIELKFLCKVTGGGSDIGDGITIGTPTGRHTGSKCNEGTGYYLECSYSENPFHFRWGKEQYHSEYTWKDWQSGSNILNAKISGLGRFVGLGIVKYNKINDQGLETVVLEGYMNPDPIANILNWQKLDTIEDKGGWGSKAKSAGADRSDEILTWRMPVNRIKVSDGNVSVSWKNWSFAEIDPVGFGGSPDPIPPPDGNPGPQFGFAEFQMRRHINFERTSACSAGGSGNLVNLYTQTSASGDTDLSGTDYRAGEKVMNTSSKLYNKIIIGGKVYLRKAGSGQSTDIKIRNSAQTVIRTLATIAAASVGTSETEIAFSDTGNTYRMQVGDFFSLESNGTSSNFIAVFRDGSSSYDGGNSKRFVKDPTLIVKDGDLKAILDGIV